MGTFCRRRRRRHRRRFSGIFFIFFLMIFLLFVFCVLAVLAPLSARWNWKPSMSSFVWFDAGNYSIISELSTLYLRSKRCNWTTWRRARALRDEYWLPTSLHSFDRANKELQNAFLDESLAQKELQSYDLLKFRGFYEFRVIFEPYKKPKSWKVSQLYTAITLVMYPGAKYLGNQRNFCKQVALTLYIRILTKLYRMEWSLKVVLVAQCTCKAIENFARAPRDEKRFSSRGPGDG